MKCGSSATNDDSVAVIISVIIFVVIIFYRECVGVNLAAEDQIFPFLVSVVIHI